MRNFRLGFGAALWVLFLYGCGDGWLGRQWHNTTSHYNVYFNAEQSWNKTVLALREANKDDFRSYIELYNYGTQDNLKSNLGVMDDVVKKVSTMIDKHPKSRWVDDGYLLMAKAYFMKGDFIAAKDIFEYVISNFKDAKVVYSAKLWIFQCLYYQGKYAEAESLAVSLKGDKEFPKSLEAELYKALGAVSLKNNKIPQAAEYLKQCLKTAKGKMERYRLHFALAQALQKIEKYDEAAANYVKVVHMTPPYELAFNSRINQVEILSLQKKDYAKANKLLRRMLKDDKNLEYYSEIYHRMGVNELRAGNSSKGLAYLNQSLREGAGNRAQSTTTYLTIGDYYYGNRNFEKSALYYDSANMLLDENHPDYEIISKKSLKLSELLRHLLVIKKQDSLLRLARDPILREKTIDRLIALEKERQINAQNPNNANNKPQNTPLPGNDPSNQPAAGAFPFYNMNQRNRGITDFQAKWGERSNRDYWNINSKKLTNNQNTTNPDDPELQDTAKQEDPSISADENRKKYYREIPLTKADQEQAEKKIEEAIFLAAGVYQTGFGELDQAITYYKDLLRRFPESKYKPQALYEMAKIYKAQGKSDLYDKTKKQLADEYPDSIYLKLLDDPDAAKNINKGATAKREIEELYEKMYAHYLAGEYDLALQVKKESDTKFAGNSLQPKFDLLAGLCEIKNSQAEQGIARLKQVSEDYPNTPEGDRAAEIVAAWVKRQSPEPIATIDSSDVGGSAGLWKAWDNKEELFYIMSYPRGGNSNLIRAALNDYNKENYIFESLDVSTAAAVGETIYISVKNFSKPEIAQQYVAGLMAKTDFFASRGLFEYDLAWISKTNFQALATNNRINSYFDFFKTDKK